MRTECISRRHFIIICLGLAVTCVSTMFWSCTTKARDRIVQEAYELRMNGKAASAKTAVEQIIAEDSTNAAAWFELARTNHHIGLGDPRKFSARLEEIQEAIEEAVKNDPDNVIHLFYKAYVCYLRAYVSLSAETSDAKRYVDEAVAAYESLLNLKPDYYEAMLYLVEILGVPEDVGGDRSKAETYAKQLEQMDEVCGARARELLLPDDVNKSEFWQKVLANNPDNADVLERLGKAHLYQGKIEEAAEHIEEAMRLDSSKQILLLDLARFRMMSVMKDEKLEDIYLPLAEKAINRYLDSEPIKPLRAYALGLLAKVRWGLGDNAGADELRRKASAADPHYSKAFGVPPLILFEEPDEVSHYHGYFFRPF